MTSNDLKRGLVFLLDSSPCLVLDLSSQSPSARGGSTLIKTKYRNLLTGQVLEKTFKAGERVDDADFEKRKGQFLYADGDNGIFMDLESYEQYELGDDMYGPVKGFLLDGTEVVMGVFEGEVISSSVNLPFETIVNNLGVEKTQV
jgi:elongation factor P